MTLSLCPICATPIPAEMYTDNVTLRMRKTCPTHGAYDTLCENDATFWEMCQQPFASEYNTQVYNDQGLVEVTDRCQLKCKHCYHMPDNKGTDVSAHIILAKAGILPTSNICLIGAEPTLRDDLPEIIRSVRASGKRCSFYTNAIRLAEPTYADKIKASGVDYVSVSVHNVNYNGARVFDKAVAGLRNLHIRSIAIGQISFTVETDDEACEAYQKIAELWQAGVRPLDFCVRFPADIGWHRAPKQEWFVSDLWKCLRTYAATRNWPVQIVPNSRNNPYHVRVMIAGQIPVQLIKWPTIENIDLSFMNQGPWAMFDGISTHSFALAAILRDHHHAH